MTEEQLEVLKAYREKAHELYYEVLGEMDTKLINQAEQTVQIARMFDELFGDELEYVEIALAFRKSYNKMIEAQKMISESRGIFEGVSEALNYKLIQEINQ